MLLTPFSSAHPHLLNLNQGWDAWPFISPVSSGWLFHLTSSHAHPFFSDLSLLSLLKHFLLNPKGAGRVRPLEKPLLRNLQHPLQPCCLSEAAADLRCLPALFFSFLTANQQSISWRATCGKKKNKKNKNNGSTTSVCARASLRERTCTVNKALR